MKKLFLLLAALPMLTIAQDEVITKKKKADAKAKEVSTEIQTQRTDTTEVKRFSNWTNTNKFSLDLSQVAFVNWNAGGVNSVSGVVTVDIDKNYAKDRTKWDNEFLFRYGSNWQDQIGIRKTDDLIQLTSGFGYKTSEGSNWFYSAKFNFNTQAYRGYDYKDKTFPIISNFMAPAYILLGLGAEYNSEDKNFKAYISPLTQKTTLVLDQALADAGAFGVDAAQYDSTGAIMLVSGKNSRTEMGAYLDLHWKKELATNINMENRLNFFTDYLNNFGNIDVNWQFKLDFVVNKYVRANIFTHLIYDDDIKATEEINGVSTTVGPKIQLKQMLGVGFAYEFK